MTKSAILYDSHCKLCNAEIEYYKKKDPNNIFDYIDIMNPEFIAQNFGLKKSDVHKYFHVISKEGKVLKGVEAFHYIWIELDTFHLLQKLYSFKLGQNIMKLGYNAFVVIRPILPRKKDCGDYCEI